MNRRTGISAGDQPAAARRSANPRVRPEGSPADAIGVTPTREGLLVGFRVTPSARRTRIAGIYGDRVKVHVSAPPEDGRANAELTSSLASWLGLSPGCVTVHSGNKGRDKLLAFSGIAEPDLRLRLRRLVDG